MRFLRILIFLFSLGIVVSCGKKKYPESVVLNDAVYYNSFRVDGMPVVLKAGVDNYYMYASIAQDSNKVYNFLADLKKTDCQSCPLSLQIRINDYKISALNAPVRIDSSLIAKSYAYLPLNGGTGYEVRFFSTYNRVDPGVTYLWSFGDGTTSTIKDPLHNYPAAGTYLVKLTTKGSGGCESTISSKLKVGQTNFNTFIRTNAQIGTGTTISYSNTILGGTPSPDYLWDFGDGQSSQMQNPTHIYPHYGAYAVTLRLIDATGDTAFANYNAVTKSDNSSCAINLEATAITAISNANATLSKIGIAYTDEFGVVYQSQAVSQPSDALFEIVSIENGDLNEKGEPTMKLRVRFRCRVANGTKIKTIDGGEAVIGVAYK